MEDIELPEPLEWVWRLDMHRELYGTISLRAGGYLDQPAHASRDIETAFLTYRRCQAEKAINSVRPSAAEPPVPGAPQAGGEGFLKYMKTQQTNG